MIRIGSIALRGELMHKRHTLANQGLTGVRVISVDPARCRSAVDVDDMGGHP